MREQREITIDQAKKARELLGGNPHDNPAKMAYIKPQSPIHGSDDWYNKEQEYQLITREYLIKNYAYSFSDGRFYYAYNHEELQGVGLNTDNF